MRARLFLGMLFMVYFSTISSQTPQGFNYQAIARDVSNNVLANQLLPVRITLQTTISGGTVIWEETHSVTTNQFGLMGFVIGTGIRTGGTALLFTDINWGSQPLFIKTEIQYPGPGYIVMGTSQLWSVPYSLMAKDLEGPVKKLGVTGTTVNLEEALFEVKNNTGQTVFAVYNEGVRVFVDDGAKGPKGGFAIGGFGTAKAPSQEYLRVTRDSTRVYVNPTVGKGNKGGFAIGNIGVVKGANGSFVDMTSDNYFIGYNSGSKITTGKFNSFIGYKSGLSTTTGGNNTFLGYESGRENITGSANTFMGQYSGQLFTSGNGNVFMGVQAGYNFLNGNYNVFIGAAAGAGYQWPEATIGGQNNVAVGTGAGFRLTTGNNNIFLGNYSGFFNTSGSNNVFLGYQSGMANSSGLYNTFLGYQSGLSNTVGNHNVFLGYQSGYTNLDGVQNVFIGDGAGYDNSSGSQNVFIGVQSGTNNTTGGGNVFMGWNAGLLNTQGFNNAFFGLGAGYSNTTAAYNTFMGFSAGLLNQTGQSNTYLGSNAGRTNLSGFGNIVIGESALYSASAGDNNTIIGLEAGYDLLNGNGNVFIGNGAGGSETSVSNKLYIENSVANKNSALIYGEFDLNNLTFNANVGIGKTSPLTKLDIEGGNWDVNTGNGDFRIGSGIYSFKIGLAHSGGGAGDVRLNAKGGTNRLIFGGGGTDVLLVNQTDVIPWTNNFSSLGSSTSRWTTVYATNGVINTSDARLKENIEDMTYGLADLLKLRPVSFYWTDGSDSSEHLGLVAQEVESVISEVVKKGSDDEKTLGINYSELVPVLIKSIQDQQKILEEQAKKIAILENAIESLKSGK